MFKKEYLLLFVIFFSITAVFFYKTAISGLILFPGDLLIAEYNPWKSYTFLGYNPGSFPNKAQYFDVLRQLYPWKLLGVEQLKNLTVPLWNPYNFSGSPLLANFQSALLYPLNLLYIFFSSITAWSILVFLQPFLAGIFTYLYGRKIQLSIYGSFLSGISYAFSHFMIVWIGYNTIGHVMAWFPMGLLALEYLLQKKTASWTILFALSIVSMILGGHIQIAGYSIILIIVYWCVKQYKSFSVPDGIFFLTLLILSIGISAIQLVPGLELISHAARSNHNYDFLINKILIQPYQLVMILIPDFFGNPATRNYSIADTYVGKVISVGVVSLLFALVAIFTQKNFYIRFFTGVFIAIVILITKNPFTQLMYMINIPIISSSAPTLASFLLAFSASMLSGFGLDIWIKNKNKSVTLVPLLLWGVLLVLGIGVLLSKDVSYLATARKALLYQSIILMAASVLFYIGIFKRKLIIAVIILLFFVQLGESWRAFQKFNPFVPVDLAFPNTSVISFLQNQSSIDRFWGYRSASIEANYATAYKIFSPEGYDPLYPKRYGEFLNSSYEGKILSEFSNQTRSDATISQHNPLGENSHRLKILNMMGVKFILDKAENGSSQVDFPPSVFNPVFNEKGWTVHSNSLAAPRYFLTNTYTVFTLKEDFEKKFFDRNFNPSKEILLEKDSSMKLSADESARVDLISYKPQKIVFKTSSKTNQLLFLSDTYFPGWKVYIDDIEKELLRANYAFRAVAVPANQHTVTMIYDPISFKIGITISAISVIGLAGFMFTMRKRV